MQTIDVEIEKLVYGGAGLGRVDGRTVMVPFTLPGERLTAEIRRETPKLIQGRAQEFQVQSESRTAPACPVFAKCGGCNYQHVPYEAQLEFKREILRESLARLGKIEWNDEIPVISAEPWGYRNRTQLRIWKGGKTAEVGFMAAASHRFVAADECPINSPKLNEVHAKLREMARAKRFPHFLHELELFTNETDVQLNVRGNKQRPAKSFFEWLGSEIDGLLPGEYLEYPSGEDLFRVGSRSFFQVNRFLTDRLAQTAVEGYGSDGSNGSALDLYAGVGLLTLPLARRFAQTTAVDSSGAAVRSLGFNARRAGVEAKVVHMNVDAYLAGLQETPDLVVADPPRAGLGPAVTQELVRLAPPQISLVSCDPTTLARDLQTLTASGYRIAGMTLLDLFPQTYHLETIVRLDR